MTPYINNNTLFLDYCQNMSRPGSGYERVTYEILATTFKTRILVYSFDDREDLNSLIINPGAYTKTISIIRTHGFNYSSIYPKTELQTLELCRDIIDDIVELSQQKEGKEGAIKAEDDKTKGSKDSKEEKVDAGVKGAQMTQIQSPTLTEIPTFVQANPFSMFSTNKSRNSGNGARRHKRSHSDTSNLSSIEHSLIDRLYNNGKNVPSEPDRFASDDDEDGDQEGFVWTNFGGKKNQNIQDQPWMHF